MQELKNRILPLPKKITDYKEEVRVERAAFRFAETCDCPVFASAKEKLEQVFAPVLTADKGAWPVTVRFDPALGAESYAFSVGKNGAAIRAGDSAGLFYAAVTLGQIVRPLKAAVSVPRCRVEDSPSFPERGVFLEDRYGSEFLTLENYKTILDTLAEMKYNSITLGVYGCWAVQYDNRHSEYFYLPLKKHPELKTPMSIKYYDAATGKYVMKEDQYPTIFAENFFGEVVRYAASKNVKIRPLFNSFGHNTLIPREHPELSALDENGKPSGKGICTSNPKTRKYMFGVYDEIVDNFLKPNGVDEFHIGFDEVLLADFCHCKKCRKGAMEDVALDYAIALISHLKEKGIRRVHMYHDTVFPYYRRKSALSTYAGGREDITQEEINALAEQAAQRFKDAGVYENVVMDWWNYSVDAKMFGGRKLNSAFQSVIKPFNGYYHWVGQLHVHDNVRGCARRAEKYNFRGIETYAAWEWIFHRNFAYIAESGWNGTKVFDFDSFDERYLSVAFPALLNAPAKRAAVKKAFGRMDEIGDYGARKEQRFNLMNYYWTSYKRASTTVYPRCYMDELKTYLFSEKTKNRRYLDHFIHEARLAASAFVTCDDPMGKVYYASAVHFEKEAEAYRALFRFWDGKITPEELFGTAIPALEDDLLVSSETRMPATYYQFARNLSIFREILLLAKKEYEKTGVCDPAAAEQKSSARLKKLR